MPRIHPLSPQVINKIAAGEVIERPASVVKELLENSLDALSSRIDVDIEEGGAALIRITDDGKGIHPDDLPLAVASHATSKLRDEHDLFRVHTMGFRGEALASIAEVSHLRIRSREPEALTGSEMTSNAGHMSDVKAVGCPPGTQIEIRDLFVSVPVRRKFLKRPATEFGHIADHFLKIALANPQIHMTLRHNGKGVHDLPSGSTADRLRSVYGALVDDLIPVEGAAGDIRLWGFVAPPKINKNNRKQQFLFLNGRCVTDRSLQHALGEAYRGLLMVGRQPVAFLYLEMPPSEVDVNVHPTKSEVRFRDSSTVYRLLLQTLRAKFLTMEFPVEFDGRGLRPAATPEKQLEIRQEVADWATRALSQTASPQVGRDPSFRPEPAPGTPPVGQAPPDTNTERFSSPEIEQDRPSDRPAEDHPAALPSAENVPSASSGQPEPPGPNRPQNERAMQMLDTYLVFESAEGMTVIDQHALHERIMYEQLRPRVLSGEVEVQRLLMPVPVELEPSEAATVVDNIGVLKELGLEVDGFGGSTVLVSSYPSLMARADPAELLKTAAACLADSDRKAERRDLIDSLLHSMSCKAAIKAGQRLSPEEIDALLTLRHLVDDSHHCPHGRPTALVLSRDELDRQFGRLG